MEKLNLNNVNASNESPIITSENNQESKSAIKGLISYLRKLKLLGVVVGTMLISAESASAQQGKEGTMSSDSVVYNMAEGQTQKIIELTHEVESMARLLQDKFKGKVPLAKLDEFQDDKQVGSYYSYNHGNITLSANGSWVLALEGDTIKSTKEDISIEVSDKNVGKNGEVNPAEKESYSLTNEGGIVHVDHYSNKTGKDYNGEMTDFRFDDSIQEKSLIVTHFIEGAAENKYQRNLTYENGATENGFEKLQNVLLKLKDKVAEALKSAN